MSQIDVKNHLKHILKTSKMDPFILVTFVTSGLDLLVHLILDVSMTSKLHVNLYLY